MNKIYLIRSYNDDCGELIVGYATTSVKASKMIEKLKEVFEDSFEYTIIPTKTDVLIIDGEDINF